MIMLRNKEISDIKEREANMKKLQDLQYNKASIQAQIDEANRLRQEAFDEYVREKDQVDTVVQRMIEEDNEFQLITA
jgi:hypothetical protein